VLPDAKISLWPFFAQKMPKSVKKKEVPKPKSGTKNYCNTRPATRLLSHRNAKTLLLVRQFLTILWRFLAYLALVFDKS
jgi:hypothetical protein